MLIVGAKNHPTLGMIYDSSGGSLIDWQFSYKRWKSDKTLHNGKLKQLISHSINSFKVKLMCYKRKLYFPWCYTTLALAISLLHLFLFLLLFLSLSFSIYFFSPPFFSSLSLFIGTFLFLSLQLSYHQPSFQGYFLLFYQFPPFPYPRIFASVGVCTVQVVPYAFNAAEDRWKSPH